MAMTMDTKECECVRACVCVCWRLWAQRERSPLCPAGSDRSQSDARKRRSSLEWSRLRVKGSYATVLRGISRTSEQVVSMWVCSEGWCGASRFWRRYSPWRRRRILLCSSIVLLIKINRFSMDYGGDWCCLLPLLVGKVQHHLFEIQLQTRAVTPGGLHRQLILPGRYGLVWICGQSSAERTQPWGEPVEVCLLLERVFVRQQRSFSL